MSSDDQDYSSDGGDHNRAPVSASRSSHNAGGADRSHRPLRAHSSSTAPYFLPAPHSKLPNRYPPSYRIKPEQGIPGNPVPGDGGPYPKFPEFPLQPVPMPAHSSREGSGSDEEGYSDDDRHRRGPHDQHLAIASGSGGGAYGSAAPPAFPPTREDYDQLAYQENFEGEELQDANGMATLPPKPIKRGSGPTKLCVCQWPGCGMVFKKMGHLNQHMCIHTGEKPFQCEWEGCNERFPRKENLQKHMRKHSNAKPFECPTCGYRSSQRSNVTRHAKTCKGSRARTSVNVGSGQ